VNFDLLDTLSLSLSLNNKERETNKKIIIKKSNTEKKKLIHGASEALHEAFS